MKNAVPNDRLRTLIHTICLGGASTLSLTAVSMPSQAADAAAATTAGGSEELSEITVTGLRASLQKSLDIKKNSDGIVDAISAEDIGKFPDSNLATALERIPGVTVSRASVQMGGTGATTGNATQITVRGFGPQFNETLFDGRQVASALGSRAFDFGAIGANFVGQMDVLKTPDATLSSGAIGATINIKYPKPFDHPGMQLAGSISGTDSTGESKVTPIAGLLFSNTFSDDRFGILADVAYSDIKTQGNHVNIQGWEGGNPASGGGLAPCQLAGAGPCPSPMPAPTIRDWFIQDYGIYQEHTDDKRVEGRLVLQAKPMDGLELTLDDNYSQEKIVQDQYGFSVWFNNSSLQNVTQAPDGT